MRLSKEELAKILADNSSLGIDNANALQSTQRPQQAIKQQGGKIPQPEQAKATVSQIKRHAVIKLGYPGCVIAENNCYEGFGKRRHMKDEARAWQNDLIVLVQNCGVKDWRLPLKVRLEGTFQNQAKMIDMHNLKLVYDGIQIATGLNDKNFHTETIPGVIDKTQEPFILITVTEV